MNDNGEGKEIAREIEAVIGRRLEQVERQNRNLRRSIRLLGATLALIVLGGMGILLFGGGATSGAAVIESERFVLRDGDGFVRGIWTTGENGSTALALRDRDGRERLRLTTLGDGSPGVAMSDRDGRSRVVLGLLPDETSTLVFADGTGSSRTVLGVAPGGSSTLVFADATGRERVGLGIADDGEAGLTLYDLDGNTTAETVDLEDGGNPGSR